MADILDQLLDYLEANQTDPLTYLIVFFLFSVATAVLLPIPIEIGLIWNPGMFFPIKALDMGLGKSVGSIAVFYIGRLLGKLAMVMRRWGPTRRIRDAMWSVLHKFGVDRWALYKRLTNRRRKRRPDLPDLPKWGWLRWFAAKSESFVRKRGIIGIYVLMSIPGMIDTVPLYVFAILNKEGTLMRLRDFALANLLAGVNRAFIIFAVLEILGWRLF